MGLSQARALGADPVLEWDRDLGSGDPLGFPGYADPVTNGAAGVLTGIVRIGGASGIECAIIHSDFAAFGGSMGVAAGEKIARAFRRAAQARLPVVAVTRTGGARMQEGMLSLVQMPRTVAAVRAHAEAGVLSLGILRSPTTGGVFASWASLLDLRAAEPGAVVGFAGPRVVAQMTGQRPPPWSHNAESAFAAGLVDALVDREEQGEWLAAALGIRDRPLLLDPDRPALPAPAVPGTGEVLTRARHPRRPSGLEWAAALCTSWVELHGPDPAIRAGLATIAGRRSVVVAMDRHARPDRSTEAHSAVARPGPAAYRLVQRAADLAGKLGLPLVAFIDTPGADPAPQSESGGIAREIAATLDRLERLPTASVAVCVGEGGSGGAIALAHADRLLMLEQAVFSVIGPEAAAVILWRDASRSGEATRLLRITAPELVELGICDAVLPEPAAPSDVDLVRAAVGKALTEAVPGDRNRRADTATRRWLTP
ncbi:carboxyl transferase domain-containing protein [Dactylosporangium sp. NPDC005572]|uniref:carboxyl transferase domain-containing protein n=1 Tax=Dactylosporangium sp. NPDC005572 TaxID=3156889 RepID=UPI0033BE1421